MRNGAFILLYSKVPKHVAQRDTPQHQSKKATIPYHTDIFLEPGLPWFLVKKVHRAYWFELAKLFHFISKTFHYLYKYLGKSPCKLATLSTSDSFKAVNDNFFKYFFRTHYHGLPRITICVTIYVTVILWEFVSAPLLTVTTFNLLLDVLLYVHSYIFCEIRS